jgi:HK97 family phage portal protein
VSPYSYGAAAPAAPRMEAVTYGPSSGLSRDDQVFARSTGFGAGGPVHAGVTVSEYTALNVPTVYACWNRIGNPLALAPLSIRQNKPDGGSTLVTEHPLSSRLGLRPNDFMSSRTLRKTGMAHALGWGNGYIEIELNNKGEAVGLWPLLPWATRPVKEDGRLYYRTTIDGEQYRLDYDQVLHIMDLSQDGYIGESPIGRARQALGMALATEEFGAKFFANDAKSGGFLMHPDKVGAGAAANLRASFEEKSGIQNAHRVKVLEEGMKFVQTTIPPEDAQFLGTRLFQIGEIARIYDVPLILLQSHDGVPSWGTGIEQLMIGFVNQTIAPWVYAWEQELNWKLFTGQERERGLYCKFNLKGLLRGDSAARGDLYTKLFGLGAYTPNRILELEDEEPIGPDGDKRFISVNYVPLDQAGRKQANNDAPEAAEPESVE